MWIHKEHKKTEGLFSDTTNYNINHIWTGSFHYSVAYWQLDIIMIIKSPLLCKENSTHKLKKIIILFFSFTFYAFSRVWNVLQMCAVPPRSLKCASVVWLCSPTGDLVLMRIAGEGDYGGYLGQFSPLRVDVAEISDENFAGCWEV